MTATDQPETFVKDKATLFLLGTCFKVLREEELHVK